MTSTLARARLSHLQPPGLSTITAGNSVSSALVRESARKRRNVRGPLPTNFDTSPSPLPLALLPCPAAAAVATCSRIFTPPAPGVVFIWHVSIQFIDLWLGVLYIGAINICPLPWLIDPLLSRASFGPARPSSRHLAARFFLPVSSLRQPPAPLLPASFQLFFALESHTTIRLYLWREESLKYLKRRKKDTCNEWNTWWSQWRKYFRKNTKRTVLSKTKKNWSK